jgi:hypothetical protein
MISCGSSAIVDGYVNCSDLYEFADATMWLNFIRHADHSLVIFGQGGVALSANPISEKARNFIFEHVDSVEALEILLFFFADPSRSLSFTALASELRSNPNSAESRTQVWRDLGIIHENPAQPGTFSYSPANEHVNEIVAELANQYRIQRHKIYELIFSPMKKARAFADAFRKPDSKDGKQDG